MDIKKGVEFVKVILKQALENLRVEAKVQWKTSFPWVLFVAGWLLG